MPARLSLGIFLAALIPLHAYAQPLPSVCIGYENAGVELCGDTDAEGFILGSPFAVFSMGRSDNSHPILSGTLGTEEGMYVVTGDLYRLSGIGEKLMFPPVTAATVGNKKKYSRIPTILDAFPYVDPADHRLTGRFAVYTTPSKTLVVNPKKETNLIIFPVQVYSAVSRSPSGDIEVTQECVDTIARKYNISVAHTEPFSKDTGARMEVLGENFRSLRLDNDMTIPFSSNNWRITYSNGDVFTGFLPKGKFPPNSTHGEYRYATGEVIYGDIKTSLLVDRRMQYGERENSHFEYSITLPTGEVLPYKWLFLSERRIGTPQMDEMVRNSSTVSELHTRVKAAEAARHMPVPSLPGMD